MVISILTIYYDKIVAKNIFGFLLRYDFVDVVRQSVQVILIKYYTDLVNAAKSKNIEQLK